jgi:transposase
MNLYRRRSVLVRMAADGQRLGKVVRVNNDPARRKREIAKAGPQPKVVLEASLGWYWAADALAEAGAEVHLAHPLVSFGKHAPAYKGTGDTGDAWR